MEADLPENRHDELLSWKLSYNATLPSPGCHILIVGPSQLTTPLASALLRVASSDHSSSYASFQHSAVADTALPSALAALDRLYNPSSSYAESPWENSFQRQRQIHLAETWSDYFASGPAAASPSVSNSTITNAFGCRMDHVILVVSPSDVPGGQRLLIESCNYLHDDYILYPRVSIVSIWMPMSNNANTVMLADDPWRRRRSSHQSDQGMTENELSSELLPGVPVFVCWGPPLPTPKPGSNVAIGNSRSQYEHDYNDVYHHNYDMENQNEKTRSSLLMVARMILQRVWIGTRRGNSRLTTICPLLACEHS